MFNISSYQKEILSNPKLETCDAKPLAVTFCEMSDTRDFVTNGCEVTGWCLMWDYWSASGGVLRSFAKRFLSIAFS